MYPSPKINPLLISGPATQQAQDSVEGCPAVKLPKDIWWHIHSLLPLIDAARVACLSQDFVQSWRFCPNLTFTAWTLNFSRMEQVEGRIKQFISIVDNIMKKHSGIGVKIFKLDLSPFAVLNGRPCYFDHLDSWLQIAVKQGIEELILNLRSYRGVYRFPCTLLSGETGASLRSLRLSFCRFHPAAEIGLLCLTSLTSLQLSALCLDEEDLNLLLSVVPALESLEISYCQQIVCIRIPCLQKLSFLRVCNICGLQLIESKAPNLSKFCFSGKRTIQLFPLGLTQRIEEYRMTIDENDAISYACTKLPSIMPNLRTLTIFSYMEEANIAMMTTKFVHLKFLSVDARCGLAYDLFSLLHFLFACPSLETFVLRVRFMDDQIPSVFSDSSSPLRTITPKNHHDKLKSVRVDNFCSAKMLVEFMCQIVEAATTLEHLTLDTSGGASRCRANNTSGQCLRMCKEQLVEARRSVLAVQMYIKPKFVSSTAEVNVVEPCSLCHTAAG